MREDCFRLRTCRLMLVTIGVSMLCLLPIPAHGQSDAKAQQILELTNQDRVAHGLKPLEWDSNLAAAAAVHAARMADAKSLSHQYPGESDVAARAAQAGAHFQAIAENTAMGPSAGAIEKQWMSSVPHRTNILDPQMNTIGIGVAEKGGYLYAVEDFANSSQTMTKEQAEERVSDLLRDEKIDPSGPHDAAEQACAMSTGMPQGAGARAVVRFETPDLSQLPSQVAQQLRSGQFTKAAVGACAPSRTQGSFTTYRVAVLLY